MSFSLVFRRFALVLACFTMAVSAVGQVTFTKVADTATAFPGGPGNFTFFGSPVIHAGVVAFEANSTPNTGVFRWTNGVLQKAADFNTAVPSGSGNFSFFSGGFATYTENGKVTFRGTGPSPSFSQGLYQFDGTTLTRLVDNTTPNPMPGGTGPFGNLFASNMKDGQIAFIAEGANTTLGRGIFGVSNGVVIQRLAIGTPYPAGMNALSYSSQVGFDDGNISFRASDGASSDHGIFTLVGSTLTQVARQDVTPVPGTATVFTNLFGPSDISGSKVAFLGSYLGGFGIFSANLDGTGMAKLVDNNTAIPGGVGNFTGLPQVFEFDGGDLVFRGTGSGGAVGIYLLRAGVLTRIIDKTTVLDGKANPTVNFRDGGYANGELVFQASFFDVGSSGIFTANLGAPVSTPSGGAFGSLTFSSVTGFGLTFSDATSGQAYRIQSSSTPGSWTNLTNFIYTTPVSVTDSSAAGAAKKFYRAVTP